MNDRPLKKLLNSPWSTPLFLLVISALAFGPFIHRLGFYQDDWNIVYIYNLKGTAGIWEYYFSDGRPLTALLLAPLFRINGVNPLGWQITAVLLRWATSWIFWLCLCAIWPGHKKLSTWAAALFLVYPYFNLQPMAAIYSPHWLGYFSYFLSMYLLIMAVKHREQRLVFMAPSILISALGLITIEYFAGVELLKLYVIWLVLAHEQDTKTNIKKHALDAIKLYIPSLLVLAAFLYYRLVWITNNTPREISPKLASEFSSRPLTAMIGLANIVIQDTVGVLAAKWAETFQPELFDLQISTNRNILIILILSGVVTYFFLKLKSSNIQEVGSGDSGWQGHILVFSIAAIILGQLPAWGIGWHITAKNPLWNSRLGLPAVFGLALLLAYGIEVMISKGVYKIGVLSLLVSLSIGWQLHNTILFRNSWQEQADFFRQLLWRAPEIEANTVFSSKGEFLSYVGGYPLSFAINTLYETPQVDSQIPYWFVDVEDLSANIDRFSTGIPIDREYYTSVFHGNSNRNLSLYWNGSDKYCLWVLRPGLQYLPSLPDETRVLARSSNVELIDSSGEIPQEVYADIFGTDTSGQSTWCYYYQRAELARQNQDWGGIKELWQQAEDEGFQAQNGIELMPFIEGFARSGDWQKSVQISKRSNQLNLGMDSVLCPLWNDLYRNTSSGQEKTNALDSINQMLDCGSFSK